MPRDAVSQQRKFILNLDPSPNFGLNSQTLAGADLVSFLALAQSNGFASVEIAGALLEDVRVDRALSSIQSASIRVLGVSPTDTVLTWHGDFDPGLDAALHRQMQRAANLGARYFVLPFMREPRTSKTVSQALSRAAEFADGINIDLALESIGHIDAYRRVEDLVELIRSVGSERVGVLLDSFHFFRAGHTLSDLSHLQTVHVHALQISNSNGLPPDQLFGYRDRTFPLNGPFPVLPLVEAVLSNRPSTPVVVEIIGDEANSRAPHENAGLARSHVSKIAELLHEREQSNV